MCTVGVSQARKIALQPLPDDRPFNNFWYLLRDSERTRCQGYIRKWQERFGIPACHDPDAIFHLGDNAEARPCWSVNGAFPSMRKSMGLLWHPYSGTPVLSCERLSLLGWPLQAETAMAAGWSAPLQLGDLHSADKFAGNAYHIAVFGTWMMTCLSCVKLLDD